MSAGTYVLKLQLGNLELDLQDIDNNGFIIQTVDLGFPTPREVVTALPGQDGQQDDTSYFGPRSVQLSGAIVPTIAGNSRTKAKDKIAPYLAANARPTLLYALDPDVDIRTLGLRIGQLANPIDHPGNATAFSVQWVGQPIAYGRSTNEVDLPLSRGSSEGFSFPLSFPFSFPHSSSGPSGVTDVLNGGTYPSWPILQIGPSTDPSVFWVDPITGESSGTQVIFAGGLVIADGDYLEVDMKGGTARINGDPGASRYSFVDFANSSFGPLAVGPNSLRFTAADAPTDTVCKVLWRPAYLD